MACVFRFRVEDFSSELEDLPDSKRSEDLSTRNLTKFDSKNFQIWKFQMVSVMVLIAHGIYDVVMGTRVKPRDPATAETKTWIKDDAKATFLMSSAIEYSQLEYLITCETSHEM